MKNTKKLYGIVGLGRFGFSLAKSLSDYSQEILVLDCSDSKIHEAATFTDNAFLVSDLSRETLSQCGIQNCDVVFVCIGEKIDLSILTTLNVIELGVPKVISRATSQEQGIVLERLGAEVVYPERDMAIRLSKRFTSSHIMEYISLSDKYDITEVRLNRSVDGKEVGELSIRKKYGLNIIALHKSSGEIITDISPETKVFDEDIMVVCGEKEGIRSFEKELGL